MSGDLFEEHHAIIAAGEAFLAALKQEPRMPIDQVSRLRVKLSHLIRLHRTTEEEQIFGPLTKQGGLGQFPEIESFVHEVMHEKAKYSAHVRKWTPQAIVGDWHGYVVAVEELLVSVRTAIQKEEASIYRAVLGLSAANPPVALRRRA